MANSDDPPYLTVGTEVSAKYRGAFCEATIKVAKKMVKCKVSYGKGHSAMVGDDCIQGTLKVGAQVDVTQPDGQVLTANIVKLTDQSTYTVVFDDGDERTLKRSSLCLKGGRHFDKSESLDNLPLTDPEHFGAPAILPKKPRRRAARPNYAQAAVNGDDEEEEEGDGERKGCTYPPEFPVGKTVFLENDRRRAGWIPAVIVPAHYVLEESDRKPNTICLRSFKDGRFFAVTKNELHEFSPHKEPLLSMLDGEIQPMYMCKPAIERAMAYLDTGELPWDMDLFDGQAEKERREQRVGGATGGTTPTTAAGSAASPQAKDETSEQRGTDRHIFMDKLRKYHENRGTPLNRTPILAQKDLDLYRLYHLVQESGGMESVTREMKWRSLYLQLGIPLSTNASHALKQAYRKYLYGFECYGKSKGRVSGPKDSPGRGRKRGPLSILPETEGEGGGDGKLRRIGSSEEVQVKSEPGEPRATRLSKQTKEEQSWRDARPPSRDVPSSLFPSSPLSSVRDGMVGGGDTRHSPEAAVATPGGGRGCNFSRRDLTEKASSPSTGLGVSECKSEPSDHESYPGDTTSSTTGEEGEEMGGRGDTWAQREPQKFAENDRVLVWYGNGKNMETYEAKIIGMEESEEKRDYLVHYSGWNNRYNEWVEESRILRKVTNPTKHARPPYKKKKTKMLSFEKRKAAKESRGGGGRGGPAEQLFSHVATTEERVPPPPATPTPPEIPGGVGGQLGPPPHPPRPPLSKRRRFSDHLLHQDSSSPSPPQVHNHHHQHNNHRSPSPSLVTHPTIVHTSPPPPLPPTSHSISSSSTTLADHCHTFPAVTQTLVPPQVENSVVNGGCPDEMGMGCAIEVKKEVNYRFLPSPNATDDSHTSLLCPEMLLGSSRLKSTVAGDANKTTITKPGDNTEQSTTSNSNSESTESSTDEEVKSPLPPLLSPIRSPPDDVWSSPATIQIRPELENASPGPFDPREKEEVEEEEEEEEEDEEGEEEREGGEDEEVEEDGREGGGEEAEEDDEEEGKMEVEKSGDEKSGDEKSSVVSSEKEPSPVSSTAVCQSKEVEGERVGGERSREKRKRVRETDEEYAMRRVARRESLKFAIDFSTRPEMECEERVGIIEEHIHLIQQKWSDLKSEVAQLDRRRRRLRRKEREAARTLAQAHQFHQSASTQTTSSTPPVECH